VPVFGPTPNSWNGKVVEGVDVAELYVELSARLLDRDVEI